MKTLTSHTLSLGRTVTDAELSTFAGGVTEGGCIPDPMKEVWKKLSVSGTTSSSPLQ